MNPLQAFKEDIFFYHFHMFPVSHKSFTSKYNLKNAPQDSFYVPKIVRDFF